MIPIVDIPSGHPYPQRVTEATAPFWDALREGRLITTANATTGRPTFPPKPIDPHTWSQDVTWIELAGRGTLYSFTTIHAAPDAFVDEVPYRVCVVDLDEGLRLATRLWGSDEVRPGDRVEIIAVRYTDHISFAARSLSGSDGR
ncbi:Zn-ribbon domain-containing OB-fold protein [Nocardia jinanensis]|uniref:Acyl dehydratase n=1 Tax=Nocardia jinanensis TaxID=382504 RepID=A0A917VUM2_9NOCA|nr:OB-fold domain-containing protein [Nocardia jinanensis]GGL16181.1 acyl dehydratase [Nocardia jinanensis]